MGWHRAAGRSVLSHVLPPPPPFLLLLAAASIFKGVGGRCDFASVDLTELKDGFRLDRQPLLITGVGTAREAWDDPAVFVSRHGDLELGLHSDQIDVARGGGACAPHFLS